MGNELKREGMHERLWMIVQANEQNRGRDV